MTDGTREERLRQVGKAFAVGCIARDPPFEAGEDQVDTLFVCSDRFVARPGCNRGGGGDGGSGGALALLFGPSSSCDRVGRWNGTLRLDEESGCEHLHCPTREKKTKFPASMVLGDLIELQMIPNGIPFNRPRQDFKSDLRFDGSPRLHIE